MCRLKSISEERVWLWINDAGARDDDDDDVMMKRRRGRTQATPPRNASTMPVPSNPFRSLVCYPKSLYQHRRAVYVSASLIVRPRNNNTPGSNSSSGPDARPCFVVDRSSSAVVSRSNTLGCRVLFSHNATPRYHMYSSVHPISKRQVTASSCVFESV